MLGLRINLLYILVCTQNFPFVSELTNTVIELMTTPAKCTPIKAHKKLLSYPEIELSKYWARVTMHSN